MAYVETTDLALKKAVVGTNQPFETTVINANWDKVDAAVIALKAGTTITHIDGGSATNA
jgi:hypothetical protein